MKNPSGDPFCLKKPQTLKQGILFGMGIGLYWGEGLKRGRGGVRLTNTDAGMILKFIDFLDKFFGVKKEKLRFSIHIFSDISKDRALNYWQRKLKVKRKQFYKTIVSPKRGKGTYRYKSEYGLVIVYFNNVKLKRLLCGLIENIV